MTNPLTHSALSYKGAGVYVIVNERNGKVYVGSALSMHGRVNYHRSYLRRGKHHNPYLQASWLKWGEQSFRFLLLEKCSPDQCLAREQFWIDSLEATNTANGYNIALIAGGIMHGRKHSPESRARMSEKRQGTKPCAEAVENAAKANKGKKRSIAVCAKIAKGRKGMKFTEEHKTNLTATHWSKGPNAAEIIARINASKRAAVGGMKRR